MATQWMLPTFQIFDIKLWNSLEISNESFGGLGSWDEERETLVAECQQKTSKGNVPRADPNIMTSMWSPSKTHFTIGVLHGAAVIFLRPLAFTGYYERTPCLSWVDTLGLQHWCGMLHTIGLARGTRGFKCCNIHIHAISHWKMRPRFKFAWCLLGNLGPITAPNISQRNVARLKCRRLIDTILSSSREKVE